MSLPHPPPTMPPARRVVIINPPSPPAEALPGEESAPIISEVAASSDLRSLPPPLDTLEPFQRAPLLRLWARRGVWLGLLAGGIGGLGQLALRDEASRGWGWVILALAMMLAAAAWGGSQATPLLMSRPQGIAGLIHWRRGLVLRGVGIAGALLLALGSIRAWQLDPTAIFGLQGWLWLASMALLLLACARWYPRSQRELDLGPAWTRGEVALFSALVLASLLTHLVALDAIPWRFHYDEVIANSEALHFYGPPQLSFFTTTWWETGLPSLWFTFAGGLMHLAGTGLGGTRAAVALIGALTVVPVYGLGRLAWGRMAATLAAIGVIISATYVHYSRVSIPNITTAFFWAACFYFLLRGLRSRRPGDWVWAGLLAGVGQYTYYGTRLLPYLLLAYGAYLVLFHFRASRERLGHFALLGVGFLCGFGPLLAYFGQNPAMWAGRGLSVLNVPPTIPSTWDGLVADWNILAPLMERNLLGLSVLDGRDTVYFAPFFPPLMAVLLALGVGTLVWRWRQPAAALLLLWGGGVIGTSTLLDASTIPNFAHWAPAFPALFLTLALPPALWWADMRRQGRRAMAIGAAVLVAGVIGLTIQNSYEYLVAYPPRVRPDLSLFAVQGRTLEAAGPHTQVHFVGNSWQPPYPDVAAIMAPGLPIGILLLPSRELPLSGPITNDLLFFFYDDYLPYLRVIQSYYPGGTIGHAPTPGDTPVITTYRVPVATAMAQYGVQAQFTGPSGTILWQGQVPTVGAFPVGVDLAFPLMARWQGALHLTSSDPFQLQVAGVAQSTLTVLDTPYVPGNSLQLDVGWVPFSVEMPLNALSPVRLLLHQGNAPGELSADRFWPQAPGAGLAVGLDGLLVHQRIDPFVGVSVYQPSVVHLPAGLATPLVITDPEGLPLGPATGGGSLIRWTGEVQSDGGIYGMELRTSTRARLTIDNVRVIDICGPLAPGISGSTGLIKLDAGWHRITLDYQATGGADGIQWLWTRPDGVSEVVPPARLRHTPGVWPAPPSAINCGP